MKEKEKYRRLLELRQSQEKMLFLLIKNKRKEDSVLDVVKECGISIKRAYYILSKWLLLNYYNYGTNIFYGWLEVDSLPF